jgi:anti-sigma regulatory factor (Ser/Thr protein kinase)
MPRRERELWLPADLAELAATRRLANEAAASCGLDENERFAFTCAVNEAVSNAIEHGSPSPEGTIRLRFAEEDDALVFCVQDYGTFAPRASMNDPLAARGRGLAFMAAMVDDVDVRRDSVGTLVRLSKRRPPRLLSRAGGVARPVRPYRARPQPAPQ